MDEASDQSVSKRALLVLKITTAKSFDVGFWVTPVVVSTGCWRDNVLGGWIYGGGHGRGGTSKRNIKGRNAPIERVRRAR
jgi:hypothetical protein